MLHHFFIQSKVNQNKYYCRSVAPFLGSRLHVLTSIFDWFIRLSVSFVIGLTKSVDFCFYSRTLDGKILLHHIDSAIKSVDKLHGKTMKDQKTKKISQPTSTM